MKQVIQSYRTGELELAEVPAPGPAPGCLIVRTVRSVVSVGTERYMLDLAKKSLLGKAVARPDLARQVINKLRAEGAAETYRQVMGRLDNPVPLGYSSAGIVMDVGAGVEGFAVGDRVACSGAGYASHAEFVRIPRNLVAKIPDGVGFEDAAFVTLGCISLHGIRLAEVTLGERVLVLGLGLLGLLAVQILKANGCRVIGLDVDPSKLQLAREFGADRVALSTDESVAQEVSLFTGGAGADVVLIFAATSSNQPIEQAAELARDRARIVVPGLVGVDLPRKVFYEKELSFRISRAWGPGLYDPAYEERHVEYPASFVRWTAQRNMTAFLELMAGGQVRIQPMITHRFEHHEAVQVYERILSGKERFTGVVLTYPDQADETRVVPLTNSPTTSAAGSSSAPAGRPASPATAPRSAAPAGATTAAGTGRSTVRLGFIGAGMFARGTLLPALKRVPGYEMRGIATSSGVSARHVARKYGMPLCTTRTGEILEDAETDAVMILTRHGSHARLASEALKAGKHVFLEKPLALDEEQLSGVVEAYSRAGKVLMVGFNRRFAPTTVRLLGLLEQVPDSLMVLIRVNAGSLPATSWVNDPADGGGPIVGECCHFVDLAQGITRSLPVRVYAEAVRTGEPSQLPSSVASITLEMANGSVATIVYTTGGDRGYPREHVEVFGGGGAYAIQNFRTLTWSKGGRVRKFGHFWTGTDRGYLGELTAFARAVTRGEPLPIRFEEYVATTRATFAALESLRTRKPVDVPGVGKLLP